VIQFLSVALIRDNHRHNILTIIEVIEPARKQSSVGIQPALPDISRIIQDRAQQLYQSLLKLWMFRLDVLRTIV
jgi:hypothetical protein